MPNTPIPLSKIVESFPNGGRAGFLAWLKDRCTITRNESIEHHHGVDHVWRKFTSIFTILGSIIFYEPIFRPFLQQMMRTLHADGVKWVDLRLAFVFQYYREGQEVAEARLLRQGRDSGEPA